MPSVIMPDGTIQELPDPSKLTPGEIDHLKSVLNQIEMTQIRPTLPSWKQIGTEAAKGTARHGIPLALQAAGAVGGTMAGGPGLGAILESVGGAGGEALVQQMGLAEPSVTNIILGGVIPPAVRGVGAGTRATGMLPARLFAGREAFGEAAENIFKKKLLPGPSFDELITKVQGSQARVPLQGINKTIDDILAAEAQQAKTSTRKTIEESLQPIKEFVSPPEETLTRSFPGIYKGKLEEGRTIPTSYTQPQTVDLTAAQLFEQAKRLRREAFQAGDPTVGQKLYKVRESMLDALEQAGVAVRPALARYKKEEAVETLGSIAFRAKPVEIFKNTLKKDKYFSTAFSQSEQDDILKVLRQLPGISPSGSRGIIGRAVTGATGIAQQNIPLTIAGMTAPDIVGGALVTHEGRRFLEFILTHTGQKLTYPMLGLVAQFVRIQAGQP